MSIWMEIRSDYFDEEENKIYIDAWKTADVNEEGEVIAKIDYRTKQVEYINERAATDDYAQEVIKQAIAYISKERVPYS